MRHRPDLITLIRLSHYGIVWHSMAQTEAHEKQMLLCQYVNGING